MANSIVVFPKLYHIYLFLYVLNSGKGQDYNTIKLDLVIEIQSSGKIRASSRPVSIDTWCSDSELNNIQHWPEDELNCNMLMGLHSPDVHLVASKSQYVKVPNLYNTICSQFFLSSPQ